MASSADSGSDSEDEFRSCFADDDAWPDERLGEDPDESSVAIFFKGASASGASGVGVVMERPPGLAALRVRKRLEFYVDGLVADYLALLDGLLEALRTGARRVHAFTDSEAVYDQIVGKETLGDQLLVALGQRILEHADKLEDFVLKLVPSSELELALQLAQEAIGIFTPCSDVEERKEGDVALHQVALNGRWRHCLQCRRVVGLTQGCYHATCLCGHEFCYSCDSEYRNGVQTCQCTYENLESCMAFSAQASEPWSWETFDSLPRVIDGYSEQERAQVALIHRFLSGEISLGDQHSCQSPPRSPDSYIDTLKDLHQLPWLERFVSVMGYNYHDDFIR